MRTELVLSLAMQSSPAPKPARLDCNIQWAAPMPGTPLGCVHHRVHACTQLLGVEGLLDLRPQVTTPPRPQVTTMLFDWMSHWRAVMLSFIAAGIGQRLPFVRIVAAAVFQVLRRTPGFPGWIAAGHLALNRWTIAAVKP